MRNSIRNDSLLKNEIMIIIQIISSFAEDLINLYKGNYTKLSTVQSDEDIYRIYATSSMVEYQQQLPFYNINQQGY